MSRTRILVGAIAIAAALVVGWRWRSGRTAAPAAAPVASPSAPAPAGIIGSAPATPTSPRAPAGGAVTVRRTTPAERTTLRQQIAAARQRARAATSTAAASPDAEDVVIPLERAGAAAQEALAAAIPILAECYRDRGGAHGRGALARMTMISDPAFGTVIDTSEVVDATGAPLAPELDACLRDRIDELALPPLGEGGKLPLEYTFVFDQ